MVTRRTFLATNLATAALSTFGIHRPVLAEVETEQRTGDEAPPRSNRDFWNDWPNYITRQMNQAREARRKMLATIQSRTQVEERNTAVRDQIWTLLGGKPEKTPMNPRITGTIQRNAYRVEKLIFESMPQIYVTANLYLPTTGKRPFPAILAPHRPHPKR